MDTKGCLILIVGIIAMYSIASGIAGVLIIIDGDYDYALKYFYPLLFMICLVIVVMIHGKYVYEPREKLKESLRKMHNYPKRIIHEDGEQWGKAFQRIIEKTIDNVTEEDKKKDLQQCERIVKKMTKEKSFDNLHRAFRLTGCHVEITDDNGKLITKVV